MNINNRELPDFKEGEELYWSTISPDIRLILINLESFEDWIYYNEQFPELFEETANLLATLSTLELEYEIVLSVMDDLIMILSAMPFRQSIYALSWIETHSNEEFGWGLKIYHRAEQNLNIYNSGDVIYDSSHVIKERVAAIVKLNIAGQIFSNPMNKQ